MDCLFSISHIQHISHPLLRLISTFQMYNSWTCLWIIALSMHARVSHSIPPRDPPHGRAPIYPSPPTSLLKLWQSRTAGELGPPDTHNESCTKLQQYMTADSPSAFHTSVGDELRRAYTLNSSVAWEEYIVDDCGSGAGTHYIYSRSDIDTFITHASKLKDG